MARVQNLLDQPLELDFEKDYVVRISALSIGEVKNEYLDSPVMKRNASNVLVLVQPKAKKKIESNEKADK